MMDLKPGVRIRLRKMQDDPAPIPVGTTGTVTAVQWLGDWIQVHVKWDIDRSLMLSIPPDEVEVLP
jgi:hypothetical protein